MISFLLAIDVEILKNRNKDLLLGDGDVKHFRMKTETLCSNLNAKEIGIS